MGTSVLIISTLIAKIKVAIDATANPKRTVASNFGAVLVLEWKRRSNKLIIEMHHTPECK
jgi:hypothetical protein